MYTQRLVTIVRGDLSLGYQIAQATHSVAEYVLVHTRQTRKWNDESNYVLALAADDEYHLEVLTQLVDDLEVPFKLFYEPDQDAYTSLTFLSTPETDEITKDLPLAGLISGTITKESVDR